VTFPTLRALLRRLSSRAFNRLFNPRFAHLQRTVRGMLNPVVYRRLYGLAHRAPDLPIVEVGGGRGAGSIALAWGMKESGKTSKLIVVEKMEGGSRSLVGDYQTNLSLVLANFRRFGVEDRIILYPHDLTLENGSQVQALAGPSIAAFMTDADGRLDRDFQLFWPLLIPGGKIVVDDFANEAHFQPISEAHPQGGTKCLLTYRLLSQLTAWGLFRREWTFQKTVVGVKPPEADWTRFDPAVCASIIAGVERERLQTLQNLPVPSGAKGWGVLI
jgi:predicted O-methyltransferase YrrM